VCLHHLVISTKHYPFEPESVSPLGLPERWDGAEDDLAKSERLDAQLAREVALERKKVKQGRARGDASMGAAFKKVFGGGRGGGSGAGGGGGGRGLHSSTFQLNASRF